MRRNFDSRLAKLEAFNSPATPPTRVHLIAAIDDNGEADRAALIADGRAQREDVFIFLVPLRPTDRRPSDMARNLAMRLVPSVPRRAAWRDYGQ